MIKKLFFPLQQTAKLAKPSSIEASNSFPILNAQLNYPVSLTQQPSRGIFGFFKKSDKKQEQEQKSQENVEQMTEEQKQEMEQKEAEERQRLEEEKRQRIEDTKKLRQVCYDAKVTLLSKEAEYQALEQEYKELQEELSSFPDQLNKLRDELRHSIAESEIMRDSMAKQMKTTKEEALVDFVDDLVIFSQHMHSNQLNDFKDEEQEEHKDRKSLINGYHANYKILHHVFNKYGLKRIESLDQPFNDKLHEQDHEIEDKSKKGGTCAVVLEEGFTLNDKVLKKAKVGKVKKSWGLF